LKEDKPKKFRFNFKEFYPGLKYYAVGLYHKFDEDHVWIMSASVAFNILICIIPFTLILFSILGVYLSGESINNAVNSYLSKVVGMTPELQVKISTVVLKGTSEIANNSTLTAIIGTIGILWTASGLFSTIRDVLNRIYKTRSDTFYLWAKLRDIGMVIVISTVFLLSFSSTFILSLFKAIDETFFADKL
jgi:membrane protein